MQTSLSNTTVDRAETRPNRTFNLEHTAFHPHWLLRGGHLQTLAGALIRGDRHLRYTADQHVIPLEDGDQLVIHDDCPKGWTSGEPFVLLLHGLGGCHQSPYMVRLANKFSQRGIRVFRMDHRGCGAGWDKARRPYHAGITEDARRAYDYIALEICSESEGAIAGFSLSGNLLVKMLGEDSIAGDPRPRLRSAVAVSPPLDLQLACGVLTTGINRFYERHFMKILCSQYDKKKTMFDDGFLMDIPKIRRRIIPFDDCYTAWAAGYQSADEYYAGVSGAQFAKHVQTPTLILGANDDPMIPSTTVQALQESLKPDSAVSILLTQHGGHLGFVAGKTSDPDRWWMDWRVIDWVKYHFNANGHSPSEN